LRTEGSHAQNKLHNAAPGFGPLQLELLLDWSFNSQPTGPALY
jgi:hypothetical protein